VVATAYASGGMRVGLIALGVFFVYQQVENHLLQPIIQRHTLRMNPLLIALSMLVGTAFAGVLGALLALPVAGAVQVVAQDRLARRQERWLAQGLEPVAEQVPPPPREAEGEDAPGPRH
jgi:putative heme transporter